AANTVHTLIATVNTLTVLSLLVTLNGTSAPPRSTSAPGREQVSGLGKASLMSVPMSGGISVTAESISRGAMVTLENPEIDRVRSTMVVEGSCTELFTQVREELERNFAERGEVGASVCVTHNGETVVDLWGGRAGEPAARRAWERDTITHVWSATKGATALCAHILASRGQLDINAPVVKYWPEFGTHGKEV